MDIYTKYHTFALSHTEPTMRTCSRCGHQQAGDPGTKEMRCQGEGCGHVYCFDHGAGSLTHRVFYLLSLPLSLSAGDACQNVGAGDGEELVRTLSGFARRCEQYEHQDEYQKNESLLKEEQERLREARAEAAASPRRRNLASNVVPSTIGPGIARRGRARARPVPTSKPAFTATSTGLLRKLARQFSRD